MDIFVLEKVVKELKEIVIGTIVREIYGLPDNTVAIKLNKKEGDIYLILSASSQFSRIYLDNELSFKSIKTPFRTL